MSGRVKLRKGKTPPSTLDLHGLRGEEAVLLLEKYLDRAFLAGLPRVEILHGRGTGALRKVASQVLAAHPLVSSFRPADITEGGDAVTIVWLVERE